MLNPMMFQEIFMLGLLLQHAKAEFCWKIVKKTNTEKKKKRIVKKW